ncbi:N-acetylglucosamine-6-phosphate deacetylase [Actinomycetospora endophytica]|uniref:N-acetylglucosamine-6-phosphate deacetylase n=1 Tax=Actinomycetospora endophytica TaxID=2291215 RepID=A0ABS8PGJ3_9PSEU|nr:N-acetylglucosamine-6-phosphate deacetylase [Actinomycetospora endophytica]MCD2196625.1 N-acetylglucosamine-6-phosphate deacetylase [Actinomycetospora endophytica]
MRRRLGVGAALVDGVLHPGDVAVADGVVEAVGLPAARGGALAVAGLVDVQCNGYAGIDLTTLGDAPDVERVDAFRRAVAADGVTAVVPTIITAAPDTLTGALACLDESRGSNDGARLLGAHVEGPFLAPARRGTHPPQHLRAPDHGCFTQLLDAGDVAITTLAPELDGALDLVRRATSRGVTVMAGHSDATAAQAHAGFDGGITGATHLFNAMSGFDHRAPGLAAAALAHPGTVVSVIADGHHVAPDVLRVIAAAAAGRWALVTDATAAAGMPDGRFTLGDVELTLADGAVRNPDGTLAGSAATLAGCVRTAVAAGIDLAAALVAATATPAGIVPPSRRPHRDLGRLRPGGVADVTVFDDALEVTTVLVAGRPTIAGSE